MKNLIVILIQLLFISLIFSSCIILQSNYDYSDYYTYLSVSDEDIEIKENKNNKSNTLFLIPKGKQFFSTKQYSVKKRSIVEYNGHIGYSNSKNIKRIKQVDLSKSYIDITLYNDTIGHYVVKFSAYERHPYSDEYKSKYNDFIKKGTYNYQTNSSGTVKVNGYYRKDGTYVRSHTRSAPKRR